MKIAEISTLFRPVPPVGEGSVEFLVHLITEGLVQRGHDVTLFATADSQTSAHLESPVSSSYSSDSRMWDWQLYEAWQVREVFRRWREFDVIHCHSYHFGLLFCDLVPIPSLHSIHIEPGPDYPFLAEGTANRAFHLASRYQARDFPAQDNLFVVPHGIPMDRYHVLPMPEREGYLAFLGRFIPEKGPLEAIGLARKTGRPLKLAAPVNDYYRTMIEPEVDGRNIEYVGEVAGETKAEFLANASALLYPVQNPEPFGLVLIEAMASGTPVVAFDRGAVREIIEPGVTGWIGDTSQELLDGIGRCHTLDPQIIRARAEKIFSSEIMVDRLEAILRHMVGGQQS